MRGCMCGCIGNWTYTSYGACVEPGVGLNVNETTTKRQATKLMNSSAVKTDEYNDTLIVYTDTKTRTNAAYYKLG